MINFLTSLGVKVFFGAFGVVGVIIGVVLSVLILFVLYKILKFIFIDLFYKEIGGSVFQGFQDMYSVEKNKKVVKILVVVILGVFIYLVFILKQ